MMLAIGGKARTKTQFFFTVTFQRFCKTFHWMFIRDRRNTNLTRNIMMAALITINSTLDNAGVLDPLLKFILKNWDVTQFIILLIIKKLLPIIINFHNFLVFFIICLVILIFLYFFRSYVFKFSFISSFVFTSHSHLRHFQ